MPTSSNEKELFVILDCHALIHRAWHALPPLETKKGELVNALYGFFLLFFKIVQDYKPTYIAATFDAKGPTFRHEQYKEYKAQRVKQPDELYQQIPLVKEVLEAFGVPVFEKSGFEADDLIGTLTTLAKNEKNPVMSLIVTGDQDAMQLVNDSTEVLTLKKGITDTVRYNRQAVIDRYQLTPEQMIEYKILRGDPSDNIPGLPGVGEVTATMLLKEYGTLDRLYKVLHKPSATPSDGKKPLVSEKLKEKLLAYEPDVPKYRALVTIVCDVPMEFSLESCRWGNANPEKLNELFQRFEFQSLERRLPSILSAISVMSPDAVEKEIETAPTVVIETAAQLKDVLVAVMKSGSAAMELLTEEDEAWDSPLVGMALAVDKDQVWYIDVQHIPAREFAAAAQTLLGGETIIHLHDAKFTLEVFQQHDIVVNNIRMDTMIASYLLRPGTRTHTLETLAYEHLQRTLTRRDELTLTGRKTKKIADIPLPERVAYLGSRASAIIALSPILEAQLKEQSLSKVFETIELPLVPVLARMEATGVLIDDERLKELSLRLTTMIAELQGKIIAFAGMEFNIQSPLQMKEVLFEKMGLSTKGVGKTKSGLSTAAEELEKMRDLHPIIPLILEYRELTKLRSTYIDALPELIRKRTGRLHARFNQAVAATGRLSSSNPNLQNIPIRTELGNEVRKAFIAPPGRRLVSLDYAQIELRIIASLANDDTMIKTFRQGGDVHVQTAAAANGVAPEDVTTQMRRVAKTVNFGIIYGLGSSGLAQATGLTRAEAKAFIEKYFSVYKGVAKYIEETKALALAQGYVETLFGRRRYLPDIHSHVPMIRAGAERMAINMPVQGTQADIIKLAMIAIDQKLPHELSDARLILQVHDELVFECAQTDVNRVAELAQKEMESVVKLKVPIEVHVKVGDNWGEMESL